MSITLEFSGNKSQLDVEYFPPIELRSRYECGLISLYTYNSIPNINNTNNVFDIGPYTIKLPEGSYEINDIITYITEMVKKKNMGVKLEIIPNLNTLKIEIKSSLPIYFNSPHTIGKVLGFSKQSILPNTLAESDLPVNINKVNSIRVECNLVNASYKNNELVHTIHEFSPDVSAGYKICEVPHNIIYFPINTTIISKVNIKLLDQDGDVVDFRNEKITIRLHLRPQQN